MTQKWLKKEAETVTKRNYWNSGWKWWFKEVNEMVTEKVIEKAMETVPGKVTKL